MLKSLPSTILASLTLGGCAGRYVDLHVVPLPTAGMTVQQRIHESLANLHEQGKKLADTYKRSSQEADLAQVPLVGAAIATAVISVDKPNNAASAIAKIGIGTGAYTVLRTIVAPTAGPEIFRRGVDAINCVLVEGYAFEGPDIAASVKELSDSTIDIDTQVSLLTAAIETEVVIPDDITKKEVELAKANAKLAIARAVTASLAARVQLGAWESAPAEFERAEATIISTLANKASVRTVIDVSALAASWTKAAQTDAHAGSAQALAGSTADSLITRLEGSTATLNAGTAALMARTAGFMFSDRLKAVAKCPVAI